MRLSRGVTTPGQRGFDIPAARVERKLHCKFRHFGADTLFDRSRRFVAAWSSVTGRWGNDIEYADLRYPNGFAVKAAGMRFISDTDKAKK